MVRIDCDGVKCDYPSQGTWRFGSLVFSSEFCSGNIASVTQLSETSYELCTSPDCAGTQYETSYRTWFYFSVSGVKKDQLLNLCISNLNPQTKMFNQGMKPVWRKGWAG
eukprot:CAMPEP_0172193632 /NCGR_PEP_ID=MMETSP1050-20130122/25081_1 /TAXON_ID=233186 /ORGANISM="Cryptomonas curvata, Strain CCAP979/52" /LENGTH=108 /DNA_ID=CAMNT_0012869247 /DNA_START=70 /DNA_END=392 /DNA_ORIENTATION=+